MTYLFNLIAEQLASGEIDREKAEIELRALGLTLGEAKHEIATILKEPPP